jgi:glucose/arabinose dehydrogenase
VPRFHLPIEALGLGSALLLLPLGLARPCAAVEIPTDFQDELVADGLDEPVNFDFLPDGRILLVERATARIRLVLPGALVQPPAVGTIPDVESGFGDQGLLGIAVDPRWPVHPYVYVHHTAASGPNIKIVRYALTGDLTFQAAGELVLDSLSRRVVLTDLPSDNLQHNGGTLLFGPDDLLYVALGDDNIRCSSQDRHQLRGKILRLDVRVIPDGGGGVVPYALLVPPDNPYAKDLDPRAGLVWHRGLRNPWSFDFDFRTSRMAIADVGNAAWEEVDVIETGGRNFGWPIYEGPESYDPYCILDDLSGLTSPAYTYAHASPFAGASVMLGGICQPADDIAQSFPDEYWGDVFFYDLLDGRLQRLKETAGTWAIAPPVPGQPAAGDWGHGFVYVNRMRFGADGGLWYVSGPELRRMSWHGTPVGVPPPAEGDAGAPRLAAFPSPARGAVTIEYARPAVGEVRLDVFDAHGRRIRQLAADRAEAPGLVRRTWDGRADGGERVRPGVYFVRLAAAGERWTRRVVVLAPE